MDYFDIAIYPENGVGKCGCYDYNGNRIPPSWSDIDGLKYLLLARLTGIRLSGFERFYRD